jgi:hypothetical protein
MFWIGVNRYNKYKQEKIEGLGQKLIQLSADDLLYDNTVPDTMDLLKNFMNFIFRNFRKQP